MITGSASFKNNTTIDVVFFGYMDRADYIP